MVKGGWGEEGKELILLTLTPVRVVQGKVPEAVNAPVAPLPADESLAVALSSHPSIGHVRDPVAHALVHGPVGVAVALCVR